MPAKSPAYPVETDLNQAEEQFAREKLTEFNLPFAGPPDFSEVRLAVRDESGALVAALYGTIVWEWLHISVLWTSEAVRGQGYGRELMLAAEKIAIERQCRYAKLHTFSFQARPFYEAAGYKVIATTENFPPGHTQFLMFKPLLVTEAV